MATKKFCDMCGREILPGEITPVFAWFGNYQVELSVTPISVTDYQVGSGEKYQRPLMGDVCSDCTIKVVKGFEVK